METGSRARKARSSNCSGARSARAPSRTSSTSCSATPVPPETGLPAARCRFGRCGGWTAWGRTPGPSPSVSASPPSGTPGSAVGVGGALYPEWDVHNNRYRPEHCRVIDFPLSATPDVSDFAAAARRGTPPTLVPPGPRSQGPAPPARWRRPRHRGPHRSVRRPALRLLPSGEHLPGTPQTRAEPRRTHPPRRLRFSHRHRSGRPLRPRPPATRRCHPGPHPRGARRPRRRLRLSLPWPIRRPSPRHQTLRATVQRRQPSPAQPPPASRLHAPRRRHPRCRRNSQDRSRHPQPPAGRPLRRLPLRRRLRSALRRSRRPQSPRRAPQRRHRLPLPFHRCHHSDRRPPPGLWLGQPRQRPDPGRPQPAHGRALPRLPQRARRAETARFPSTRP